jgi:predicted nucleotidyltransferase
MFKKLNILKIFFEEPTREFNVREIARILDIAPATASKELKGLVKQSILKERKQKTFNLYKANLESDFYRDLKIYYNLRKIKDSGLLEALNKFYLKPTIVLFGSVASGLDTETSDFDLLVISEKIKEFPESKKFEKKLNRKLQIFVVKNIKELKNKHLINNVVNGITLQGTIKWI